MRLCHRGNLPQNHIESWVRAPLPQRGSRKAAGSNDSPLRLLHPERTEEISRLRPEKKCRLAGLVARFLPVLAQEPYSLAFRRPCLGPLLAEFSAEYR